MVSWGWECNTDTQKVSLGPRVGRQTTKEQIEHAVLDGETCFTDPGVASGWFNSVPTEDLPTKATLGSDAAFAERVHQIPLEPGLLVKGRDWPQFNTTAQRASS